MSDTLYSSIVGDCYQMFQPRCRRTAVERFGAERYAFLQIPSLSGHDERCRGVQQGDVAIRAWLPIEDALQGDRVGSRIAAFQPVAAGARETGLLRRHIEGADMAILQRCDEGWAGEGDFIEAVRAVNHPDRLG